MNTFYVETYDNYDWHYNVIAETKEDAIQKLKDYWESEEINPKTIHEVSGPYEFKPVMQAKGPNL